MLAQKLVTGWAQQDSGDYLLLADYSILSYLTQNRPLRAAFAVSKTYLPNAVLSAATAASNATLNASTAAFTDAFRVSRSALS